MNLTLNILDTNLPADDSLKDAIEKELFATLPGEIDGDVTIDVSGMSMQLASGYGTWIASVDLHINGERNTFKLRHHNEDWFLSKKIVWDHSVADSEDELKEALSAYQDAFDGIINANISHIAQLCVNAAESEIE